MTHFTKNANGKYVVKGKSFDMLIGTRAQVWHGTAYKTSGGLTKGDLIQNKAGRIVSKAKYHSAKKEMRLVKAGYGTKKGKFGFVKLNKSSKRGGEGVQMEISSMGGKHSRRHRRGGAPLGHSPVNPPSKPTIAGGASLGHSPFKPTIAGGRRSRRHRGGSGVNYALSPSSYDGQGVGTSGVDLQFVAGNAA
jgi:hypothetical protein